MPPLLRADLDHCVMLAEADLRALGGGELLVTGAAGAVGSWLVETALHANQALGLGLGITALVRDAPRFAAQHPHLAGASGMRVVQGDVRTFNPERAPTHIVHAASAASPRENAADPDGVIDIIERGTARVLDCAAQSGAARLLHISSGSVYDRARAGEGPIAESAPTLGAGTTTAERFGAAKRSAEVLVNAGKTSASIARLFTLIGPRIPLDGQFAVGQFLGDALASRPVRVTGDGSAVRTYLHMADLAVWCWAILARGAPRAAYNVGATESRTIADVARAVARMAAPPVAVEIGGSATPRAPDRYIPDTSLAHRELGLQPRIGFDDALARTWRWLRSP